MMAKKKVMGLGFQMDESWEMKLELQNANDLAMLTDSNLDLELVL